MSAREAGDRDASDRRPDVRPPDVLGPRDGGLSDGDLGDGDQCDPGDHGHGDLGDGGPSIGLGTALPPTPPSAQAVFREHVGLAEHYAALLCTTGVSHGLIGPREGPRIWERHLLNCAVVGELVSLGADRTRLIDVGSGAGLPGLAIAIARPDLEVHLVEPLARRTAWLEETVGELRLSNVTVHTARAESLWGRLRAPWVTARAVTKIVQLAQWTLPLLEGPGSLLALKGSSAADEVAKAEPALRRLGAANVGLLTAGQGRLDHPTTVVRVDVTDPVDPARFRRWAASSAGSARRRGDRPRSQRSGARPTRSSPPPPQGRAD